MTTTTVNGATAPFADFTRRGRIRQLIGRITDRQSHFRAVLHVHRADLGELVALTDTEAADVLVMLDALPRNVDDLLYYASGAHDTHEVADKSAATK